MDARYFSLLERILTLTRASHHGIAGPERRHVRPRLAALEEYSRSNRQLLPRVGDRHKLRALKEKGIMPKALIQNKLVPLTCRATSPAQAISTPAQPRRAPTTRPASPRSAAPTTAPVLTRRPVGDTCIRGPSVVQEVARRAAGAAGSVLLVLQQRVATCRLKGMNRVDGTLRGSRNAGAAHGNWSTADRRLPASESDTTASGATGSGSRPVAAPAAHTHSSGSQGQAGRTSDSDAHDQNGTAPGVAAVTEAVRCRRSGPRSRPYRERNGILVGHNRSRDRGMSSDGPATTTGTGTERSRQGLGQQQEQG